MAPDDTTSNAPLGSPLEPSPLLHAHLPLLGARLYSLDLLQVGRIIYFMLVNVVQLARDTVVGGTRCS